MKLDGDTNELLIPGINFPLACVDIRTHQHISREDAIVAGILNWELIKSGKLTVDDFDQFSDCSGPNNWDKLFGHIMVSLNQRSGLVLPDDYSKVYSTIEKVTWLTAEHRRVLASTLVKIAKNKELKLVKNI